MSRAHLSSAGRSIAQPYHTLVTEAEERERRKLEGIRQRRQERAKRFMNPHERMYGMPHKDLERQMSEKKQRDEAEAEAERIWADEQKRMQLALSQRERERLLEEERTRKQLLVTWEQQRDPALRREADLNAKHPLRDAAPVRMGDKDPRLGPSSIQVFDGEDLNRPERERMQALQMRQWVAQQAADREARRKLEEAEDRRYREYQAYIESERAALMARQEEEAKQERALMARENLTLAEAKARRAKEEREAEAKANEAHHEALAKDPWLNEDERQRTSQLGPHRIRVDHYKGMTPAERERIEREREQQLRERARRAEAERREDEAWAREGANAVQYAKEMARGHALDRAIAAEELRHTLQLQAKEHRDLERKRQEDSSNQVTAGFFNYFGTSDR